MRTLIASRNFRLAADLTAEFSGIEILGVEASFADLINSVGAAPDDAPIETVILDAALESMVDREANVDLRTAIIKTRHFARDARIVVLTRSSAQAASLQDMAVETFQAFDPTKAATNLGAFLDLAGKDESARVIAVVSPQGGCGRTFIAQQLASAISERVEKRRNGKGGVILVELDLQHATIAFDPRDFRPSAYEHGRRTIARILGSDTPKGEVAMTAIDGSVMHAEDSGYPYDMLLAPHGLREVVALYRTWPDLKALRNHVDMLLEVLIRSYGAVVIDTGSDLFLDPLPSLAITKATAVCGVVTPSPAGLSATYGLRVLTGDMLASSRTRLVVNRVERGSEDYVASIRETAAGTLEIASVVPESGTDPRIWRDLAARLVEINA